MFVRAHSLYAEICAALRFFCIHWFFPKLCQILTLIFDYLQTNKNIVHGWLIPFNLIILLESVVLCAYGNPSIQVVTLYWILRNFSVIRSWSLDLVCFPIASPETQLQKKFLGKTMTLVKWTMWLYNKEQFGTEWGRENLYFFFFQVDTVGLTWTSFVEIPMGMNNRSNHLLALPAMPQICLYFDFCWTALAQLDSEFIRREFIFWTETCCWTKVNF